MLNTQIQRQINIKILKQTVGKKSLDTIKLDKENYAVVKIVTGMWVAGLRSLLSLDCSLLCSRSLSSVPVICHTERQQLGKLPKQLRRARFTSVNCLVSYTHT